MMRKWQKEIQRRFDGDLPGDPAEAVSTPIEKAYLDDLQVLRRGAEEAVMKMEISDAQFPAFMAGIREGIEAPRSNSRGFWALASLTAASLIVASAAFLVFSAGSSESVTVVEAATTYIQDATVDEYSSEDGTRGVWVTEAERDLL